MIDHRLDRAGQVRSMASQVLMRHDFPGKVRELENIIERGVALSCGDGIDVDHLPDALRARLTQPYRAKDGALPTLEQQEKKYIQWVMDKVGGNQTLAARTLGINRSSLWRKLKAYGREEAD